MKIYNYDQEGLFMGVSEARESPLEPGIFHIPALATDIEPPICLTAQVVRFANNKWGVEEIPDEVIPEVIPKSDKQLIMEELFSLDMVLPRATEDLINAIGLDITKLPQIMQDRLARKIELRNELKIIST